MKRYLRRLLAVICALAMLITAASALTVEEAIELLEEHYVNEIPAAVYEAETLEEVFSALGDPYTYYMTAEEYAAFNASVEDTTSVVGIGVQILYTDAGIQIVQVINGGPAEAAGLVAGDIITAAGGVSCVPADETSADLIRGEAGTYVTLTVLREDGQTIHVAVQRAQVLITNTNIAVKDGHIGFISCTSFGTETAELIRAGLEKHEGDVDVWWLDLRGNSGGLAGAAVEAVGLFAGNGIHLYYRDAADQYYIDMTDEPYITEHPVIVLTNGWSASASELFAADMRDYLAGIVVGERTFGKGVAQIVVDAQLEEELFTDDGLKVTAYRFYSALGNTTDAIGVIPTLLVDETEAEGVAELLRATAPEDSGGWLKLHLGGWEWYVDMETAQLPENADSLDALLEALAPNTQIFLGVYGDQWVPIPVETALTAFGQELELRWFTDVAGSPYETELNALAAYGLLRGTEEGAFDPGGALTRAQLCELLAHALGLATDSASIFDDVPADSQYADEIMAVCEMGLMQGYGNGLFAPDTLVTNEQFITVMSRLAAFLNITLHSALSGSDETALADVRLDGYADWAREGACLMLYCQELYEDGSASILYDAVEAVDADAPILREQAGATLYRLLVNTGILRY